MRSQMRGRAALLVAGLTLAASGAGASVAGATAPAPQPHWGGASGACNMLIPPAAPHMTSNKVNDPTFQGAPGLVGMFNAILITTGNPDGSCP
jgi:hypothetical protein